MKCRTGSLTQAASAEQDYEEAAKFRDRIKALTLIQSSQDVNIEGMGDADVISLWQEDSAQLCGWSSSSVADRISATVPIFHAMPLMKRSKIFCVSGAVLRE